MTESLIILVDGARVAKLERLDGVVRVVFVSEDYAPAVERWMRGLVDWPRTGPLVTGIDDAAFLRRLKDYIDGHFLYHRALHLIGGVVESVTSTSGTTLRSAAAGR